METPALKLAREAKASGRGEYLSYGPVTLQVTNLERAVSFWTKALGLVVRTDGREVELGSQRDTLVILKPGAEQPVPQGHSGLYHVAFGVPSQTEFSRLLVRLMAKGIRIAPTDHTMSKAIYLWDPDGLGIEVSLETPERFGRFSQSASGFGLYDKQGRMRSGRDPLDIDSEVGFARSADLDMPIAQGTRVAHLHLHVPDLKGAIAEFETLGFAQNLLLPQMGFADLGAGGAYTHRLAVNIWQGKNVPPPPEKAAQLLHYELRIHDERRYRALSRQLGEGSDTFSISTLDPSGTPLSLTLAPHLSELEVAS